MKRRKTILYIGGFQLPDKNAAAQRVLANAKALQAIGYNVIFINALTDCEEITPTWIMYEDFQCYEYKRENQLKYLVSISFIKAIIEQKKVDCVIAYNYPAIALERLRRYCVRNKVRCIGDVSEWYVPVGNVFYKLIKYFDTEFRMKYVHPRLDAVIAISEYLYVYYKEKVHTVQIPPLVDLEEDKWKAKKDSNTKQVKLIYAGSPSAQKEKLDVIVRQVSQMSKQQDIELKIVGITKDEFQEIYGITCEEKNIVFLGRQSNREVIRLVTESDFSIIYREDNKVVKAGFPTKVVESISAGTPVIANKFSNITDYLNRRNSIVITEIDNLENINLVAEKKKKNVERYLFDYHSYLDLFKELMK